MPINASQHTQPQKPKRVYTAPRLETHKQWQPLIQAITVPIGPGRFDSPFGAE